MKICSAVFFLACAGNVAAVYDRRMKGSSAALSLACAGVFLCGCATVPARHAPSAKTAAPPAASTNAVAAGQPAAGEEEPGEALPSGKGNPEALAHFAAGQSFEDSGQHDQAMEEFYSSVMADPGNEKTAREVAEWLLDQHHPEKAVTLLSKVARRPDVSAPILGLLARADLQAGKTNAALAASLQAIARRPDSLQSYESELEVLAQSGRMAAALKTLDQAAKHLRNTPAELVALASLYATCEGPQEKEKDPVRLRALALLDRAAAMKFSALGLWQRLGDTYARLGEFKKGADIYHRLLTNAVDSATLRNLLRERLGEILLDGHDPTNAAVQFQAIVQDDPVHYPQAWYYLGILAHAEGSLADATDDFQKAVHFAPGLEQAYYRLALVLADEQRGEDALQILDRARPRFPDSFDAQLFNALVNLQLKDFDEAVRHFSAAEALARSNNPARLDRQFYFQIGAACERAHQFKKAEDYLQKCIDMGPDNAEALNYLGFMWADRGEHLAKARIYIEKACKLEPKNAAYLDSMGWVLFKLNQPQEALPWLLKAVELSPEPDPTILDHLGDVYLSLRQVGKALENWKKSIAVEPNEDVKKKLQMFDAGAT
jgi:tetratricopeptide (TPR) repeat protein